MVRQVSIHTITIIFVNHIVYQVCQFQILGGASYLNPKIVNTDNGFRPYADDCFGALCPWWLQEPDSSSVVGSSDNSDIKCVGDCVEIIGAANDSDKSDNEVAHENGAFPKTRYHVEGKPNGISVLQARQSFLKKQLRTKGWN